MKYKAYAIVANETNTGELWAFCYAERMRMSQNRVTLFSPHDTRCLWNMDKLFDVTRRRNKLVTYTVKGFLTTVREIKWHNIELENVRLIRVTSKKSPIVVNWSRHFKYINKYNNLQRYSSEATRCLDIASRFSYTEA